VTWEDRAACRGQSVVMFDSRREAQALELCRHCPVLVECRDDLDATPVTESGDPLLWQAGVRAGLTPAEIADRARTRRRSA